MISNPVYYDNNEKIKVNDLFLTTRIKSKQNFQFIGANNNDSLISNYNDINQNSKNYLNNLFTDTTIKNPISTLDFDKILWVPIIDFIRRNTDLGSMSVIEFSNNNNLAFIDISPSYYSNKSNNNLKVEAGDFIILHSQDETFTNSIVNQVKTPSTSMEQNLVLEKLNNNNKIFDNIPQEERGNLFIFNLRSCFYIKNEYSGFFKNNNDFDNGYIYIKSTQNDIPIANEILYINYYNQESCYIVCDSITLDKSQTSGLNDYTIRFNLKINNKTNYNINQNEIKVYRLNKFNANTTIFSDNYIRPTNENLIAYKCYFSSTPHHPRPV